ncbi:MAG: hypothetical protein IJ218_00705 [Alphaproteobacteria bacterium]|nr:hypothetical protein [Alphaproteobacteria bacterium]
MRFESFSERYGYVRVDDALQIEKMSDSLKNILWSHIYKRYTSCDDGALGSKIFMEIFFEYYFKKPCTLINGTPDLRLEQLATFYNNATWYEVYDLIEFIYFFYKKIGSLRFLDPYTSEINEVLEREHSGYRLIDGLVTPITDENEIASIKEAIEENLLDTAKTHIQEALNKLSDREHPDYRNSIKESISAVEAVCRYITNKSTLDKALPKLKNKGIIIPDMLEDGMKKIYYFTNGEAGIRHALMDESTNIDFEEAKYMLVVCSAFVNYLKAKQGKVNAE